MDKDFDAYAKAKAEEIKRNAAEGFKKSRMISAGVGVALMDFNLLLKKIDAELPKIKNGVVVAGMSSLLVENYRSFDEIYAVIDDIKDSIMKVEGEYNKS